MSQAAYYIKITVGEFKPVDFVKYAVGVGGILLCREEDINEECTVVLHGGVVKYYLDVDSRGNKYDDWVIEVYGNHHAVLSILQEFMKDVHYVSINPLNICGDCYCG